MVLVLDGRKRKAARVFAEGGVGSAAGGRQQQAACFIRMILIHFNLFLDGIRA